MLEAPPDIDPQDDKSGKSYEEQQVQIKFRLKEAIPDTSQKFKIVKRNNKYEMEYVGGGGVGGVSQTDDPEFKLKPVDTKSSSATTRVSIHLDSKPIYVAPKGSRSSNAVPIYDSSQIPDVNLR